jgi:uncharacterized ferritin-like protein (DUF455 family)
MELRSRVKSIREQALDVLLERDAAKKASRALELPLSGDMGEQQQIEDPGQIPGRPTRPELVAHTALKQRSINTVAGRATLIHALTHIELNAIDLALDVVWRFAGLPASFYTDWLGVAREEAFHFQLLRAHLQSLGFDYGDFPAHNGLWEMAEKTKGDLLARIALVPRTLEARGLDASPAVKDKLVRAGDTRGGEILDIILRDEIRHVRVGNTWYREICAREGVADPVAFYEELTRRYGAPRIRGPLNLEARRAAGFDEREIEQLAKQSQVGALQGR